MIGRTVDPITFEILRHRLWMINDEQGRIALRISGSPLVYDVKDYSSALLTPAGDSLFIGPHITRLSMALQALTKTVRQDCAAMGFNDGDMFFTNDPWAGPAHQNDQAIVAPVVWQGEVVCWTGIGMHDIDVGGPTFGGYSIQAADAFSEPPIIPPIRLVEHGEIRPDLEAAVLRNSRTPELNALNLRSRIAAQNVARARIFEIIEEYGKEALLTTQERIIDHVKRAIARRLAELPDGRWSTERLIDHDGYENRLYAIRLAMTKRGESLVFDFTGTDKQVRGTINCAPAGLEGGVYSAILPMLCYDMVWCPAAIQQSVSIISEPGTINNALFPAAVGTASVSAIWATGDAVRDCLARMLACSDQYRDEAQATWGPGLLGLSVSGAAASGKQGRIEASIRFGAAGATATHDGLDAAGNPGSPTLTLENIESAETHAEIGLVLYRRLQAETAGAGKFRGGAALETLIAPHRAPRGLLVAQYSQGHNHPLGKGLYGGYPSCIQGSVILRQARWQDIPTSLDDVTADCQETLPAKGVSHLAAGDAIVSWCAGGSGFGDPLERDPALVARDVEQLVLRPDRALALYGIVCDAGGRVDVTASEQLRAELRRQRLLQSRAVNGAHEDGAWSGAGRRVLGMGDAVDLVRAGECAWLRCVRCGHVYGEASLDPRLAASYRDRALDQGSILNRFAAGRRAFVLREIFCPSCALLISVETSRRSDPIVADAALHILPAG